MATTTKTKASVAERLEALENLQIIHSKIDRLLTVRGELPLEVEELEADIEGMENRFKKLHEELKEKDEEIANRKIEQKNAQEAIIQYKEKQNNVRNNREFESINKEIEYQELEIQLHDKRMKEAAVAIEHKKEVIAEIQTNLENLKGSLTDKKTELDSIISETEIEEQKLLKKADKAKTKLDKHVLLAYVRLRESVKNGLAVVHIERDACGGCFTKVPPQKQIDIIQKKKIIACENCGRILIPGVESETAEPVKETKRRTSRKAKEA